MRVAQIMIVAALALAGVAGVAAAAEIGRYAWSQTPDGLARLDTATGAVALCRSVDGTLECTGGVGASSPTDGEAGALPDTELGDLRRRLDRLESRNLELEALVARLEAQTNSPPAAGLTLPSEQEVDKMMGFFEGTLKRFRDMMKSLEEPNDRRGVPL
ncbi:MAG: hypothetical protein GC150_00010 [Rhizobiales bacterium]|nr:hypothetical protein [Hyphomicrobiales bacterium]